jgi:hypothetical protein
MISEAQSGRMEQVNWKKEKIDLKGIRTRNLAACSIEPQATMLPRPSGICMQLKFVKVASQYQWELGESLVVNRIMTGQFVCC